MAKTKIREITITEDSGAFAILKKLQSSKEEYDFSGVKMLRQILNKEKARILGVIKNQKPNSIYDLSKKLNRSFKSVDYDLKLLERFGIIEFIEETVNNRRRLKPVIVADTITIHLKI